MAITISAGPPSTVNKWTPLAVARGSYADWVAAGLLGSKPVAVYGRTTGATPPGTLSDLSIDDAMGLMGAQTVRVSYTPSFSALNIFWRDVRQDPITLGVGAHAWVALYDEADADPKAIKAYVDVTPE